MIIYKATNLINGKSYIGKTIYDLKIRIRDHIRYAVEGKSNNYFPNALVHYGPEKFKWEVIDECNNEKRLLELEKYYIYYYDTFNNGYNLTPGGDGWTKGKKHSKESKLKMSIANKGKNSYWYGRKQSKSSNLKRSITMKNKIPWYKHSEKMKRKIGLISKGKKHSEEHKKKISESLKGEKNPFYGKKHSEETKKKMRDAWIKRKKRV